MIRATILVNAFGGGGAEAATRLTVERLAEHGVNPTLVAVRTDPRVPVPRHIHAVDLGKQAGAGWRDLRPTFRKLNHLLLETQPDVIHAHCELPELLVAMSARRFGRRPMVISEHSRTSWQTKRLVGRSLRRSIGANVTFVVPQADVKVRWRPNSRPVVIGNAMLAPGTQWASRVPGRPLRVAYVGRLASGKGVQDLIRVIANLDGAAHLAIVGDGEMMEELRAQALREAPGSVRFHGFETQPWPIAAASDLIVAPSLSESDGLAAVEAVLVGMPILLRSSPGHIGLGLPASCYWGNGSDLQDRLSAVLNGDMTLSGFRADVGFQESLLRERAPATIAGQWAELYCRVLDM